MSPLMALLWTAILFNKVILASSCPVQCNCEDGSVVCSARQLSEVPQGVQYGTVYLDFQSNNISEIKPYTFADAPNIQDLYLSDNLLHTLHPWAFSGLQNLKSLHLERNRLERLPSGAFAGLRVRKLVLDDNPLLDISPGAFANSSVEELWMRRCNLQTLTEAALADLRFSLKVLHIANNHHSLPRLPNNILLGFQLRVLFLENNGLTDTSFLARMQISTIQLYNNPIGNSILNATPMACGYLYLEEMGITSLDVDIPRIVGLRSLSLANNQISELDASVFKYNRGILTLNLRNNSINHIKSTFGLSLPHLKILDLGYNRIHVFNSNVLLGIVLDFLSIENNQLQTVPEDFLTVFRTCKNIYLTSNPLHCNCELLWLYDWMKTLENAPRVWDAHCVSPVDVKLAVAKRSDFQCIPLTMTMNIPAESVPYGSDVTISCSGHGDPSPDMNLLGPGGWTKQKTAPTNKTILYNEIKAHIPSFTCEDVGVYACSATSHLGVSLNYTKLSISERDCEQLNSVQALGQQQEERDVLHILKHMTGYGVTTTLRPVVLEEGVGSDTEDSDQVGAAVDSQKQVGGTVDTRPATMIIAIGVCSAVAGVLLLLILLKAVQCRRRRRKRYRLRSEGRIDISFISTASLTHDDLVLH